MLERFSYIFLLFKPPWFDRYRHVFAFVWKSKMLCIYQFTPSFSSPQLFGNIGKFVTKKYLTDHRTANTIQLSTCIDMTDIDMFLHLFGKAKCFVFTSLLHLFLLHNFSEISGNL